jgi:hypothetical protein
MIIQICGFAAMFFSIFSFQMNSHKHIMKMQMGANSLFAIQYLMIGAYSGAAMHGIALVRGMVFYYRDKKWASGNGWIIVFILLFAGFGVVTYDSLLSILPPLAMIMNTFSFASSSPKFTRMTILLSSPLWMIYSLVTGSIGGFVNEVFVIGSSILGVIRYDLKKNSTY